MKNSKITTKLVALILMCSLIASVTSCAKEEEEETHERETTTTTTTEETTEETTEVTEETEETSEETTTESETETSVEETEEEFTFSLNMDRQACSNEEDDARYLAFFQNEYPAYAEDTWIERNYDVDFAYVDLDGNGADELLIGVSDEYGAGVFCVVTEVNGTYKRTDVYGWAIQHGACPGDYLGNGCFCGRIGNGNNYQHESQIYTIFQYDESLQNCGIIARYSCIYNPDERVVDRLFTLNEGAAMVEEGSIEEETTEVEGYTYETMEHGLLEYPENSLSDRYEQMEASYNLCEDPYSVLSWRPVTDIIG